MPILYFSFIAAYLLLFYAIISRLNTGLDKARSINVRGIMTIAAVSLLGWPVLLARLAAIGVFASWERAIPMLWLAMAAPLVLGVGIMLFPVIRQAGKQLKPIEFVWPLLGHFAIAIGFYHLSRLGNATGSINLWTFSSGLHFLLGLISVCLYLFKKYSSPVLFRLWHLLGLIISGGEIILIATEIPRHIISNSGLSRFDTAIADLPMIWLPAMLLPAYCIVHLWGLVQIGALNISKTV